MRLGISIGRAEYVSSLSALVRTLNGSFNRHGHGVGVTKDFIVEKTQYRQSLRFEVARSLIVLVAPAIVADSIGLQHQAVVRAIAIGDVRADHMLSTEPDPLNLPAAKQAPKKPFGPGRCTPKFTGAISHVWGDSVTA